MNLDILPVLVGIKVTKLGVLHDFKQLISELSQKWVFIETVAMIKVKP